MFGSLGFQGLTPSVGATLVVALDGAGTRPVLHVAPPREFRYKPILS